MPPAKRPVLERLADKFLIDDGCWPWIASLNDSGYGQIHVDGMPRRAHRVLYELLVGPIPDDRVIDHMCRNRACVNPGHMELVSRGENVRRGVGGTAARERAAAMTHCRRGHEFTPENTRVQTLRTGSKVRVCRKCHALRARERLRRLRRSTL